MIIGSVGCSIAGNGYVRRSDSMNRSSAEKTWFWEFRYVDGQVLVGASC